LLLGSGGEVRASDRWLPAALTFYKQRLVGGWLLLAAVAAAIFWQFAKTDQEGQKEGFTTDKALGLRL
jgi:hypothetical protein